MRGWSLVGTDYAYDRGGWARSKAFSPLLPDKETNQG